MLTAIKRFINTLFIFRTIIRKIALNINTCATASLKKSSNSYLNKYLTTFFESIAKVGVVIDSYVNILIYIWLMLEYL